jgi:hypothetical protein
VRSIQPRNTVPDWPQDVKSQQLTLGKLHGIKLTEADAPETLQGEVIAE